MSFFWAVTLLGVAVAPVAQPVHTTPDAMALANLVRQFRPILQRMPLGNVAMDMTWPLSDGDREFLEQQRWAEFAGAGAAIWISIDEQMLRVVKDGCVIWRRPCSTAANGAGQQMNSNQTPLGWHTVESKTGKDAPWGQVFRSKRATRERWKPGQTTTEDLVLTRVLVLTGSEPGLNKGGSVDSFARCIYIHGTNDEVRIGQPTSHGCIRLTNDDVIDLFERIPVGTPVVITQR